VFPRKPLIRATSIDKVEINGAWHPLLEELLLRHLRDDQRAAATAAVPGAPSKKTGARWAGPVELASKVISILSGLCVIVFVALLVAGRTTLGTIQVANLLTVFSVTLVGASSQSAV
jgi:hypothetical protein